MPVIGIEVDKIYGLHARGVSMLHESKGGVDHYLRELQNLIVGTMNEV
jgi:hypothetical protein